MEGMKIMTLEECYTRMGADYADVLQRLGNEERIQRFLRMFIEEESFDRLCTALKEQNAEAAFRAAHSLKGICMNMGFTVLRASSDALTQELRTGSVTEKAKLLGTQVAQDYHLAVQTVREYLYGR